MRLIDADALKAKYERFIGDELSRPKEARSKTELHALHYALKSLDREPTVDVELVKHGKWVRHSEDGVVHYTCSECDMFAGNNTLKYCRSCGAKMQDEH